MAFESPRSSSQSAYICHGAETAMLAWMARRNASSGVVAVGVAFRRPFAFMPMFPACVECGTRRIVYAPLVPEFNTLYQREARPLSLTPCRLDGENRRQFSRISSEWG